MGQGLRVRGSATVKVVQQGGYQTPSRTKSAACVCAFRVGNLTIQRQMTPEAAYECIYVCMYVRWHSEEEV